MKKNKIFNSLTALLIGLINFTLVIYVFVAPDDIRNSDEVAYNFFYEHPYAYSLVWMNFTIMAMLSFHIIPVIWKQIKMINEEIANTAAIFGIVGYAILGVWSMSLIASTHKIATTFVHGDEFTRKTILAIGLQEVDPAGWFTFGAIGIWFILANILILKGRLLSRTHSIAGIALGAGHWLTVLGALFNAEPLHMAASISGVILYPLWYVWLSRKIFNSEFANHG